MNDEPIPESELVQVGMTPDGEYVLLKLGDPEGEKHTFIIAHGRFMHALQQLNELAGRVEAQRQAKDAPELSVPLQVATAQANASMGGEIVFFDLESEGSLGKVAYALPVELAEKLGQQLIAAAQDARSQKDEPRH